MSRPMRISAARKRADARQISEKVRECIHPLDDHLRITKNVVVAVVYVRVSTQKQRNDGNLDDQEKRLIDELKARGIQVIVVYREVCSGYCRKGRKELIAAIDHAQRENAILVAESLDRLIRPENYEGNRDDNIPPNIQDLEWLKQISGDVQLVTLISPCFTSYETRSKRIRAGQEKNGRGGRPKKKRGRYKESMTPKDVTIALTLIKKGCTYRELEDIFNRRCTTIHYQVQQLKKSCTKFDPKRSEALHK